MIAEPVGAFDVASKLAAALDTAGVPYAIGGDNALGAWSDQRGTLDVDINLFVQRDGVAAALDVLTTRAW